MKLQTSIKPRRDGFVNVTGASGRRYVFAADENGDLCAVVEDQGDLARMLELGDFFPANVADNEAAMALLKSAAPVEPDAGDGLGEDDDDLDDDDPVDMNAAPIEGPPPAPPIEAPAAVAAPGRKKRQ